MQEEQTHRMLEKVKSSLPILSLAVVIISVAKQSFYYNHFDVPINYFLELTELPILIAKDLIIVLPVYYIASFLIENRAINFFKYTLHQYEPETKKEVTKPYRPWKKIHLRFLPLFTIITFLLLVSVALVVKDMKPEYRYLAWIHIFLIFFTIIIIFEYHVFLKYYFNWQDSSFNLVFILILIIGLFTLVKYEIMNTSEGKFNGTVVVTDKVYTSNDSITYIGKTSSWVFIHNLKKKRTEIIPISEIKLIDLKTNEHQPH